MTKSRVSTRARRPSASTPPRISGPILLLNRVQSLLRDNGQFGFDVYALASMRDRNEAVIYEPMLMEGFWSANPYRGLLRTFRYERERVTLDKYLIIEEHRSQSIHNWFQYFDSASLADELDACDLAISERFGDLTGADFHDLNSWRG